MMIKPKISVITVTRNHATFLETCMISVAGQTYRNIEHIIIDGDSSDDTARMVSSFMKSNPHIQFYSEPDSGIYDAMNKGILKSSGEWIYFLGSDDIFYRDDVLDHFVNHPLYRTGTVIYGNVKVKGDASWAPEGSIYDGMFTLKKLLKKNLCHQSIFYSRDVVAKSGFFEKKYSVCADWDYNIRCFSQADFVYLDFIVAIFQGGGFSTLNQETYLQKELPENILRYFNLDPEGKEVHDPDSPFYEILSPIRRKQNPAKYYFEKVLTLPSKLFRD